MEHKELEKKSLVYTGWSDKEGNPVMKVEFTEEQFAVYKRQLLADYEKWLAGDGFVYLPEVRKDKFLGC